ncbi:MAG TPA: hypothetical protein VFY10_06320 [Dehalococcoidia bacterium]|nr:hypothetical protein [Dehalococcoidia bacterium]
MKRPASRKPATIQLHLPLLQESARVGTADPQSDLIVALVELLIGAAHVGREQGGDDAFEAHR